MADPEKKTGAHPIKGEVSVFISYSHEKGNPNHKTRVKDLAIALGLEEGIDVSYDQQWEGQPPEGFPSKTAEEIQNADHIVIVLSKNYGKPETGSHQEIKHIRNIHAVDEREHRITQVYFDTKYDRPAYKTRYAKLDLGSYVMAMVKNPLSENEKWSSLVRRLKATPIKQEGETQEDGATPTSEPEEPGKKVDVQRGSGIILVGDIVDFSEDRWQPKQQRKILKAMWAWLKKNESYREWTLHMDSSLDGAIIAFNHSKGTSEGDLEEDALDFAQEWVAFMAGGAGDKDLKEQSIGFRVGIHSGPYELLELIKGGDSKIVGRGPNDCERLTRLGGEGDIIVSEDFFRQLQSCETDLKGKFVPDSEKSEAFQAFPKANRAQDFRIYVGHKTDADLGPPMILKELNTITDQIRITMIDIVDVLWEMLEIHWESGISKVDDDEKDFARMMKAAETRISLFLPNPKSPKESLVCTQFREWVPELKKKAQKEAPSHQSPTFYSIIGNGAGPVGRAFVSGKSVVLHGLPDYEEDPAGYVKRFKPLGLGEPEVKKFTRKARSYVCIPCMLARSIKPAGTLCIDMSSDLKDFSKADLADLATEIQEIFGQLMYLLIRGRRHP